MNWALLNSEIVKFNGFRDCLSLFLHRAIQSKASDSSDLFFRMSVEVAGNLHFFLVILVA